MGNPFKASRIGKSVGYEAVLRRFELSKGQIRDKRLADRTRKTVAAALARTYRKEEFIGLLHAKGVDVVFRHTDEGRIYGATFIDHRTGCVLNGSRLGREFSANALQEHTRGTPPAWGCSVAVHRAHRLRKPPSSVTSNAGGRNAARVWGCNPFFHQLKKETDLCHNRKTI